MPPIGNPFTVLQSVDSTNNYAMAQVHAGLAKHGNTYFSLQQTSGKGQRGKAWNTGSSDNIAMSIVIQPNKLVLSEQFMLLIIIALSCYDLVKNLAGKNTKIKWPNDIYWCDRKAGGILIENLVQSDNWRYSIVGIGLNINQTVFPEFLPNAVSLKQITGKNYDLLQTARELCVFIENRYDQLQNNKSALLDEYNSALYKRNESVKLKLGNIVFNTIVKGVSTQGRLITKNAIEQELNWGEVEWMG